MKTSDFMKGVKKASESLNEDLIELTVFGISFSSIQHSLK